MRIVFMGTPSFAVPSLKKLVEKGYDIAAVITQPDRKSGRGHKFAAPPVKTAAEDIGIPVLQFEKIKSARGVSAIKEISPDIIVTAAFGQILSKEILEIPPLLCINVHASLLPKYRGAAPIQWAIINGEKKSGVTIMYMDEGLDTGDIISSKTVDISSDMTGGELYEKLAHVGAGLLADTLVDIENKTARRTKQKQSESSYYPPLSKEMGLIDWSKPANQIHDLIRALFPVMSAYSKIGGDIIKIWKASVVGGTAKPGEIVSADEKNGLVAGTGCGLLRIEIMQMAGGKRLCPKEYLRGRKLNGERFD